MGRTVMMGKREVDHVVVATEPTNLGLIAVDLVAQGEGVVAYQLVLGLTWWGNYWDEVDLER